MPGRSSAGCSPHPSAPTTASRRSSRAEERVCLDERREVLARLERRHREDVVAAELGLRAVAREDVVDSRAAPPARDPRARRAARRRRAPVNAEFAKTRSHVRAAFRYFAVCMRRVRPCTHSGWRSGTRSWIVVARIPARCGGYIQSEKWSTSIGPRKRSTFGSAEPAPALAPEVREREELERELDGDALERSGDRLLPLRARGREGDDLVLAGGGLSQTRQRPAEVRADPRARVRERRDVERDPHGR